MGTAAFVVGAIAQALVMSGTRWRRTDLRWLAVASAAALLGALVGLPAGWAGMPVAPAAGSVVAGRALAAVVLGVLVLAVRLRERALPHVNAAVVAYVAVVCLGLSVSEIPPGRFGARALRALWPLIAAAGYAGWLSITRTRPSRLEQSFLYVAYLGAVSAMVILLPAGSPTGLLAALTPAASPGTAFAAGAYVTFVGVHVAMLLALFGALVRGLDGERESRGFQTLMEAFDRQFLGDSKRALASTIVLSALGVAMVIAGVWSRSATAETARVALAVLPLASAWLIGPGDVAEDEQRRAVGEPAPPRGVLRTPERERPVTRERMERDRVRGRGKRGRRGW